MESRTEERVESLITRTAAQAASAVDAFRGAMEAGPGTSRRPAAQQARIRKQRKRERQNRRKGRR